MSSADCGHTKKNDETHGIIRKSSDSSPALVAGYEDLRRQALDGGAYHQGLGMVLFLRQGMVAWMMAWLESNSPAPQAQKPRHGGRIPENHRSEIVGILAAMALSHWQEART